MNQRTIFSRRVIRVVLVVLVVLVSLVSLVVGVVDVVGVVGVVGIVRTVRAMIHHPFKNGTYYLRTAIFSISPNLMRLPLWRIIPS